MAEGGLASTAGKSSMPFNSNSSSEVGGDDNNNLKTRNDYNV